MRTILAHPLTKEWESANKKRYGSTYSGMHSFFREKLSDTFEEFELMISRKGIEYLTRILIEHIKMPTGTEQISIILNLRYNPPINFDKARFWEYAGEIVLINTGVFGRKKFYREGKRSFEGAAYFLEDFENKSVNHKLNEELTFQSDRLRLNKNLANNYTSLVEVIENTGLINDPWYMRLQKMVNQL